MYTGLFQHHLQSKRSFYLFGLCTGAGERANKIFNQLDVNGDGELDEEEFCKV
jgi:hypothetical protein